MGRRQRICAVVGIVWGALIVLYGYRRGLSYDNAYDVGTVVGYLFGWVLMGAGVAGLRPARPRRQQRELDLL